MKNIQSIEFYNGSKEEILPGKYQVLPKRAHPKALATGLYMIIVIAAFKPPLMNVISSCSFASTAAFVYKKKRKLSGVIIGLFSGWGCMVLVMFIYDHSNRRI